METPTLETIDILDPDLYVQRGYPQAEWTLLRREAPVFWYERPNVNPFWAVTKHADIVAVSRSPRFFVAVSCSSWRLVSWAHPLVTGPSCSSCST
jgi:cytochrome P450